MGYSYNGIFCFYYKIGKGIKAYFAAPSSSPEGGEVLTNKNYKKI
jgi:hypothetical protein